MFYKMLKKLIIYGLFTKKIFALQLASKLAKNYLFKRNKVFHLPRLVSGEIKTYMDYNLANKIVFLQEVIISDFCL